MKVRQILSDWDQLDYEYIIILTHERKWYKHTAHSIQGF